MSKVQAKLKSSYFNVHALTLWTAGYT